MLHDPEMEVTCDNESCNNSVFLPLDWSVGGYDLTDSKAERLLTTEHQWVVLNGNHYCEQCSDQLTMSDNGK